MALISAAFSSINRLKSNIYQPSPHLLSTMEPLHRVIIINRLIFHSVLFSASQIEMQSLD